VNWNSSIQFLRQEHSIVLKKFHLIRDYIDKDIRNVGTEFNVADPLTKLLSQSKHDGHVVSMRIKQLPNL